MAANLIDLTVPGLASALVLLDTLETKYNELKAAQEVCARLDQRLKDFADELSKITPDTMKADELLRRLVVLIREFSKTITTFVELSFVKCVLKLDAFRQDVETYNERLDHIIKNDYGQPIGQTLEAAAVARPVRPRRSEHDPAAGCERVHHHIAAPRVMMPAVYRGAIHQAPATPVNDVQMSGFRWFSTAVLPNHLAAISNNVKGGVSLLCAFCEPREKPKIIRQVCGDPAAGIRHMS
ncbi:Serine/threonine-protein kinase pim-3 [Phytophthora pseudosyringae]|uniref:Serine/threonine-protein kinase pim-3 n=1 Tax=Phytophthora pseudosyringae TaxID=221518 RepID=A0A8T1VA26_9STRA|nr:Serine/threonine-protein kinase pim-3 [Phytophthora pseudosyringae]